MMHMYSLWTKEISIVTALWTVAWPWPFTTSPMITACHGVYGSQPAGKVPNHKEMSQAMTLSFPFMPCLLINKIHHSQSSSWTHCIKGWWPGRQLDWLQSNNHAQLGNCCCWRHEDDSRMHPLWHEHKTSDLHSHWITNCCVALTFNHFPYDDNRPRMSMGESLQEMYQIPSKCPKQWPYYFLSCSVCWSTKYRTSLTVKLVNPSYKMLITW